MLRWQDERGQRLRQEFLALAVDGEGQLHANPSHLVSWFLEPMDTDSWQVKRDATREVHDNIEQFIDSQLARKSNANLHPENREWLGAAWCREPAVNRMITKTVMTQVDSIWNGFWSGGISNPV